MVPERYEDQVPALGGVVPPCTRRGRVHRSDRSRSLQLLPRLPGGGRGDRLHKGGRGPPGDHAQRRGGWPGPQADLEVDGVHGGEGGRGSAEQGSGQGVLEDPEHLTAASELPAGLLHVQPAVHRGGYPRHPAGLLPEREQQHDQGGALRVLHPVSGGRVHDRDAVRWQGPQGPDQDHLRQPDRQRPAGLLRPGGGDQHGGRQPGGRNRAAEQREQDADDLVLSAGAP
mmetsp:Transcript_20906/g.62324  ORF Transcript_20906/g.62324 Transcript_20906/m.62324 type:complete len:228 (-) Transcript_20906:194-877(-)